MQNRGICVIGCGNMGSALVRSIIRRKSFPLIHVVAKDEARQSALEHQFGYANEAGVAIVISTEYPKKAQCCTFLIATKPKQERFVIQKLQPILESDFVFSVCSKSCMGQWSELGDGLDRCVWVRAMPNLCGPKGLPSVTGISVIHGGQERDGDDQKNAESMQEVLKKSIIPAVFEGTTVEVDEPQLSLVTAMCGSGVGFVSYFLEAYVDGGVEIGLSRKDAFSMALNTFMGSCQLIQQMADASHDSQVALASPTILRHQVCSPKGTTVRGIAELEKKGFRRAIAECLKKASGAT